VTRALVTALLAGFLLFNQALLAALVWMVPPNEPAWVPRLMLGSFGAGALAWAVLAVAQWRSAGPGVADGAVMVATAVLLACAAESGAAGLGLVAGCALALWTLRGLLRRKSVESRADPV
jgi:hypothetical protein